MISLTFVVQKKERKELFTEEIVGDRRVFTYTSTNKTPYCFDKSIKGNRVKVDFGNKEYAMYIERDINRASILERILIRVCVLILG